MVAFSVSAEAFQQEVSNRAYRYWEEREGHRRDCNWMDAMDQLLHELHRYPLTSKIRERAYQLWLARKDGQAVEDWIAAVQVTSKFYKVAA